MTSVFQIQQGTPVQLVSNRIDEAIETGAKWPCLVTVENPSSVQILVDSKDSINPGDDPFRFTIDLTTNLYRGRSIRCVKAILPKIPNITVLNNQIQIKHDLGTTAVFSLQPAFYNTSSLSNALTSAINAAFVTAGIGDTVVTSFDPITRTFSITSTGGNNFFIVNTCSFITRGRFMAPFESEDISATPSKSTIYSSAAAMLYTRYITIHSPTIDNYAFSTSITSSFQQQTDIIAIIDATSLPDTTDFDPTIQFTGC
jgi:hypothetical protein